VIAQHRRDADLEIRIVDAGQLEAVDAGQEAAQLRAAERRLEHRREAGCVPRHGGQIDDAERAVGARREGGEQGVAARAGAAAHHDARGVAVARGGEVAQRLHDQRARQVQLLELAVAGAHDQVRIGFAVELEVGDGAHDERIDRQRGERTLAVADLDEAIAAQRAIAVELAGDLGGIAAGQLAEQEAHQIFVDQRAARIVGEDAVQPRELAAQPRRRDREQDRDGGGAEPAIDREHVERREVRGALAIGDGDELLDRPQPGDRGDQLVGVLPAGDPQQAADLVDERQPRRIGLGDPPGVPGLGDRRRGEHAEQLELQLDRVGDLLDGGGRRGGDRLEAHERFVGERLEGFVDLRGDRLVRGPGRRRGHDLDGDAVVGAVGEHAWLGARDGRGLGDDRGDRRRGQRGDAHQGDALGVRERDVLQGLVDRELERARGDREIADLAPEPEVDHAEPIAGARQGEAAARGDHELRHGGQAKLGVLRAIGDLRDGEPELAAFVAVGAAGPGAGRGTLLHEHVEPAVEDDLRVDRARARIADLLAPRLADRAAPQPELAAVPQEPAVLGDRQDELAAGARHLDAGGRGAHDDRLRAVPHRQLRRGARLQEPAAGLDVLHRLGAEHAAVARRQPHEPPGRDRPQLLADRRDVEEAVELGPEPDLAGRVVHREAGRLGGEQIAPWPEEP
jgi:hypothetical protein